MKTKIIIILLCLSFLSVTSIADEEKVGVGTLVPCCDTVSVGDTFNVTFYIDTNGDTTTGFTIRQLLWDETLAELVPNNEGKNCTFLEPWIDPVFNDAGDLKPGNLTYVMAVNLGGITGNNVAINFTFTALFPGELYIYIPSTIWSGQHGIVIDMMDINTWYNTTITIEDNGVPINHAPTISNPVPSNGNTDVSISTNQLSVFIEDTDGDHFNWYIKTLPNIGNNTLNYDINGTKTCFISSLSYSTTYTWYVNVTDGELSNNEIFTFTTKDESHTHPNNPHDEPDDTPENQNPIPVISCPRNGTVNETITFNASGSSDDGEIMNYTWNFGDNTTSYDIISYHIYNISGNYTITLTITDDHDITSTINTNISIKNTLFTPDDTPDDTPSDEPPDELPDDNPPTHDDTSLYDDINVIIIPIIICIVIIIVSLVVAYIIREWFL